MIAAPCRVPALQQHRLGPARGRGALVVAAALGEPSSSSSPSLARASAAALLASALVLGNPSPTPAAEFFDPMGTIERYYHASSPSSSSAATASAPALVDGDETDPQQQAAEDLTMEEFLGIFAVTLGCYVLIMTAASALLLAFGLVDSDDEDEEEGEGGGGGGGSSAAGSISGGLKRARKTPTLHGPGGLDALLIADPWEEEEEALELMALDARWGGPAPSATSPSAPALGLTASERLGGDPALAFFEATGSLAPPFNPDPAAAVRRRAARRAAAYVSRAVDQARTTLQSKILTRRLSGATAGATAAAAAASSAASAATSAEGQLHPQSQQHQSVVRDPRRLNELIDQQLALIPQRDLLAPGGDTEAVRRVLAGVASRVALDEAVLMVERTGEAVEALEARADGGGGLGGWGAGEAVADSARRGGGGKSPLPSN